MDIADKIVYFQAITGVDDPDLCAEILAAHGWDLELAVASFTSTGSDTGGPSATVDEVGVSSQANDSAVRTAVAPGLVWKLVTLPISVISGGLGLISGAVGLGFWAVGGVLSYSLNIFGFSGSRVEDSTSSSPLVSVSATARESADFVSGFERDFGVIRPNFVAEGFMDALQRSSRSFKLLFVYLHSPEHPDSQLFCQRTLCSELVSDFVNENFVAWGGSIRGSEGFKMSNSLKASRFPFCAVVMAATNQRIAILQQVDGGRSEEEMLTLLQKAVEESGHILSAARLEAEQRRNNSRLREEQDAAYQASLEADRARDRRRREEREKQERETAEADRKKKEEEEARDTAARDAARREAARVLTCQQKAVSLGAEPPKGPDVTQVVVRFPNGERRERRFENGSTLQCVYDYVDTTGCLKDGDEDHYSLVSNFPRVVYGRDKAPVPLLDAGLHPQASLFVELISSS